MIYESIDKRMCYLIYKMSKRAINQEESVELDKYYRLEAIIAHTYNEHNLIAMDKIGEIIDKTK